MHAHRSSGTHVGWADASGSSAAIPHVSGLAQPGGGLLPALMRELATLIAAPLMILSRRWKAARCVGAK